VSLDVSIVVLAKAPVPGRVKTRLCPPLTLDEAALLAAASLDDTLKAVAGVLGARPVLALEGSRTGLPDVRVIPQRGRGLDERMAAAFDDVGGPALLIGADTPQITGALLTAAATTLMAHGVDAVLGRALDGGWWIAGLRVPDARLFLGVPMSTSRTGRAQARRFHEHGLRTVELPLMRDVDRIADARAVAASAPALAFSRRLRAISARSSHVEATII